MQSTYHYILTAIVDLKVGFYYKFSPTVALLIKVLLILVLISLLGY